MKHYKKNSGLTLLELMIAVSIVGVLFAIAGVNMIGYIEKARVARAISEIKGIEKVLYNFEMVYGYWPDRLSETKAGDIIDPWGNPYQYMPVPGNSPGKLRKDRFQVPINTDFDLYSKGRDGKSQTPLTAKASHDDVIRANNGGYVGLASYY